METYNNFEEENAFITDNIFKKGYGIIAQEVLRLPSISRDAKLFYCYLCAFAGSGDVAFPSTKRILDELGFSKKTFYKYRKELEAFGLITLKTKSTRRGKRTVYYLPTKPEANKDDVKEILKQRTQTNDSRTANFSFAKSQQFETENTFQQQDSFPQNSDEKPSFQGATLTTYGSIREPRECTPDGTMLNIDKSINRKLSINQSGFSETITTERNDSQGKPADDFSQEIRLSNNEKFAFVKLCKLSIKAPTKNRKNRALALFKELLDSGFTHEQIIQAYEKYIETYKQTNTTPRYAKQLDDWLVKADGARFFLPKLKIKIDKNASTQEILAAKDPKFKNLRIRRFMFQQELRNAKKENSASVEYYKKRFDEALLAEKKYFYEHA